MSEKVMGNLISRLDNPVCISYMGESITLSPRAVVKNVDKAKLGALPKGIVFQELK